MNRSKTLLIGAAVLAVLCSGCAGLSKSVHDTFDSEALSEVSGAVSEIMGEPLSLISKRVEQRAAGYAAAGNLSGEIACWEFLVRLDPQNQEYLGKLETLRETSRLKAELHYRQAKEDVAGKKIDAARRQLLIALRLDPERIDALRLLKRLGAVRATITYRTEPGDTPDRIAQKVYGDPTKGYLLERYNDLEPGRKLTGGRALTLPVLPRRFIKPAIDIEQAVEQAKSSFQNGDYQQVLSLTRSILQQDAANREAADLKNAALYETAARLRQQSKYTEALKALRQVDPKYKGVQKDIAEVEALIIEQAEEYYRIGVDYYVNEQFVSAIENWKKTLRLNPKHAKARKDIENARRLIKKLEKVQ
jgi:tetratricopeptide (TPR) repeat protein